MKSNQNFVMGSISAHASRMDVMNKNAYHDDSSYQYNTVQHKNEMSA
jgi:hypothetical protein